MNATPKKCILLGGLQISVVDTLFKFPKLPKDVAGIIKIAEWIKAKGAKMKSSSHAQQNGSNPNISQGKERKKLRPFNQHKGQNKDTTSNKGGYQKNPSSVGIKIGDLKN